MKLNISYHHIYDILTDYGSAGSSEPTAGQWCARKECYTQILTDKIYQLRRKKWPPEWTYSNIRVMLNRESIYDGGWRWVAEKLW